MLVEVFHQGKAGVSRRELRENLAKMYKVEDSKLVFVHGMKIQFGGGHTSCFCSIYDNITAAKKFECRYRLVRNEIAEKASTSRKQRKERKNRAKKVRGVKKAEVLSADHSASKASKGVEKIGAKIEDAGRSVHHEGQKEHAKAKGREMGDKVRDAGEKAGGKLAKGAQKVRDTIAGH
jgi:small subunit ribosomal protein S24e